MDTVINLKKENLDSINVILEKCFGVSTEYENDKIHLGVVDVVSYVSLMPFEIKIENENFKIVGICALSTLPDFRGKGYASRLIKESIQWAENNNMDFIVLYGEADFYSKFGFNKIPILYEQNNAMIYRVNKKCNFEELFNKDAMSSWKNIPKF